MHVPHEPRHQAAPASDTWTPLGEALPLPAPKKVSSPAHPYRRRTAPCPPVTRCCSWRRYLPAAAWTGCQHTCNMCTAAQPLAHEQPDCVCCHSTSRHWPPATPRAKPVGAHLTICLRAFRQRRSGGSTGNLQGMASMNMPGLSDALRSRLASLLATEFSKKVSRKAALSVAVRRAALDAGSPPVLTTLTQQAVRGLAPKSTAPAMLSCSGVAWVASPTAATLPAETFPSHDCRVLCRCT